MQWITPRRIFVPLVMFGVIVGAGAGSALEPLSVVAFSLVVTLALSALLIRRRFHTTQILIAVIVLASFCLGAARSYTFEASLPQSFARFEGERAIIHGVVAKSPDRRETTTRLFVAATAVNGEPLRDNLVVSAHPYTDVSYGDVVQVIGTLERPESFETDLGRTFDYEKYLRAHRATHVVSFAEVSVVAQGEGNVVLATLYAVKDALVLQSERILPDPEAPLLAGLLLGERQSLGEDLYESFQRAGVVHMVVLSGYNVSLVAQALIKSTEALLPRSASFVAAAGGIVAFALMTGATETTVRATVMALILLASSVLRRPSFALRALLVAAGLMVLANPYILLYDLSFQLSFLATAGIILFADPIAKYLRFLPEHFGIRDIGGATLAAQLAVLPLLIVSVGSVSIVSPLANVLVLGAVPYAMLLGFGAITLAFLSPLLAFPIALITHGILSYIIGVSVWFGNLPLAAVSIPHGAVLAVLILLALLYALAAVSLMRRGIVLKLPPR